MYYPSSENKGADQLRGTAKLICVFVFAYADCWFSHEAAHSFVLNNKVSMGKLLKNMFITIDLVQKEMEELLLNFSNLVNSPGPII